jgi:phosphoribosylpyrophosphate synthetase
MIIRKGKDSQEIEVNNIEELKTLCDKDDYYLVNHHQLKQTLASTQPKIVEVDINNKSMVLYYDMIRTGGIQRVGYLRVNDLFSH